jgi:hypothetical protein
MYRLDTNDVKCVNSLQFSSFFSRADFLTTPILL